ncbi:polar amino acid transport system substrate-binding protein [Acetitomaculum ruminis DSM 5522]|uniref:Polar amino acid transport system substrate-binding protein n=1 Tax=Acetitomaculum ruminis DSM 5522 TaxID=1120918 RepID=A0A1I0XT78_9FIRM|nr:amino acid ABC transporter substrate-binding protein [Acetitomaculum ruminis]SFB04201.1 polar amino acid transport system substrate-binding protein [Acetitomaculum ruminis DSM 5522]
MKKFIAGILCLLMTMSLVACGGSDSKDDPAKKSSDNKASEAETFTVGFDKDFPPYGYVEEDGSYAGFDIDLATEVAKRLNLEINLQPIDWDAKDMELSSGTIDCIWNGFTINGREDEYTWSDAYMNNSQVFVVRTKDNIKSTKDLAGKIVSVQTDSSAQASLEEEENADLKASFKELVVCADYNSAFMDLESGAVDAIAMDVGVARYQITKRDGNDTYAVLDEELASEQYGVGFLKGNTKLRDKVNDTLKEMVKDGTFAEISEKWFSEDVGIIGK